MGVKNDLILWRTAGQPPGGDSSRPDGRRSLHYEAMAPSAGRARSRRLVSLWLVSNQGLIAHQLYESHKAARRAAHKERDWGKKGDFCRVGDGA